MNGKARLGTRATILALVVVLALGAFLRVYRVGEQSLWDDEISTYHVSTYPLTDIWGDIARLDSSPMMYYTLFRQWILAVPRTEAWLRGMSLALGLCAVLALFLLAERLAGRRAALFAALLMAINPFQIYASQEVRYNSLAVLTVLLSYYFFVRVLERGRWWHVLGYALATGMAVYTHYFAFFVVATQLLVVAWMTAVQVRAIRRDRAALSRLSLTALSTRSTFVQGLAVSIVSAYAWAHRTAFRRSLAWLIAAAAVGLAFVPFLKIFAYQLLRGVQFREPEPVSEALSSIWIYALVGHSPIRLPALSGLLEPLRDSPWFLPALFGAVLPVLALAVVGFFGWRDRDRRRLALAYLLVPLFCAVVIVLKVQTFDPRYYMPYMPALLLFAGKGMANALSRSRVLVAICVLYAVTLSGATLRDYYDDPAYHRQDFRGTVQDLVDRSREGDAILFYYHMGALPFLYYFDFQVPYYYLYVFRGAYTQSLSERRFHLARNMERFVGKYERLWLVDYHGWVIDPLDDTRMLLRKNGYERIERNCRYTDLFRWCIDLFTDNPEEIRAHFGPVVDFSRPDTMESQLSGDWFEATDQPHRWMGRRASVTVIEPEGAKTAFATFFANFDYFARTPFDVTLAVDGVEVATTHVTDGGFVTVSGPLPEAKGAGAERVVTVRSSAVFVPAEVMGGADRSEKSLLVTRIGIGSP